MDVNEETVIATGTTASGNVRKLILNILAIKNSLVECGHNSIIIDISKNFVKIDGKEYFLSNNGNGNSNGNGNGNGNDNDNNNNNGKDNSNGNGNDNDNDNGNGNGNGNGNDNDKDSSDDNNDELDHDNKFTQKRRYNNVGDDSDMKRKKLQKGKNRVESDENDEDNDEDKYDDDDDRGSSGLSGPTLEIGKSLHFLLKNLSKLPSPAPTMNPNIFESADLYNQALLKILDSIILQEEFGSRPRFLEVIPADDSNQKESEAAIMPETDLLKLESEIDFSRCKEETIRLLSLQVVKIFDNFIQSYINCEIQRRSRLRFCVDILLLQRRIEIYCCLFKERKKGQTVKSQSIKKIVMYSKPTHTSVPKIKTNDITRLLRAARRIERLLSISNNNWLILDAFPNLTVDFFKSTSINVSNYERWIKYVETGELVTEEEGKKLYEKYKYEQDHKREEYLQIIYKNASEEAAEALLMLEAQQESQEGGS